MILKIVIRNKEKKTSFLEIMSSIEQLETLRNSELYEDCKTLVNYGE